MNVRLDWQVDEQDGEPPEYKQRWRASSVRTIIVFIVLVIVVLGAWGINRLANTKAEAKLERQVQDVLDLEHAAYQEGDGDQFFAYQDNDPAWLSAQLKPENQAANRAGLTVTRVSQQGNEVLANVSWSIGDVLWQRVAFFQQRGDQWVHVPTLAGYWGRAQLHNHEWGRLRLHEIDQLWATEIASFVNDIVTATCDAGSPDQCLPGRQRFELTVADDFVTTAAPNELRVPSPRLLGLNADGEPADLFWQRLRNEIEAQLTPATIRFAIQEDPRLHDQKAIYEQLAADFSASHAGITVEIVDLADLPSDPLIWPAEVDGATVAPSQEMIAAGLVHDLTDFAATDPEFDQGDFFEQIWQGSQWRDRMWFVPHTAEMRLLFYDKQAYWRAGLDEPSLRWTWEEMAADLAALAAASPSDSIQWSLMDPTRDSLFSYAFNWENRCGEETTVYCHEPLRPEAIAASLDWFASMSSTPGQLVDLVDLSEEERTFRNVNLLAPPGKVAVWVEAPVKYELHSQRQPTGVVPFPGSARFDGITPLWVQGGFISQNSQRPRATWEWLNYLSYQHLDRQRRAVPARPSVAVETGYWSILPRPLGEAMRAAFPFARPIMINEQSYFSWDLLSAIASGQQTPQEAAHERPRVKWFAAQ